MLLIGGLIDQSGPLRVRMVAAAVWMPAVLILLLVGLVSEGCIWLIGIESSHRSLKW